ncbi:hypothetical protein DID80_07670 [Candidatus Marinamargulisbacteria bacterium SCGC AAA071-K20]|nr:hypothetical protein DID80_07670 [Candidatus Marinamargulisbacteria bacterium SCGC AAA071-K20]
MKASSESLWLLVGFIGQAIFGARFVVQWIYSEIKKKSVIPESFWHLSIIGSLVLLSYAIYRKDPIFILGFSLNLLIYFRNLYLIYKGKSKE